MIVLDHHPLYRDILLLQCSNKLVDLVEGLDAFAELHHQQQPAAMFAHFTNERPQVVVGAQVHHSPVDEDCSNDRQAESVPMGA